jgi:hypothetical protein
MMQFTLYPTIASNYRVRQLVVQLFHLKHVLVNDAVHTVSIYRIRQLVVQLFHLKHVLVNDAVHTVSNYRIHLSYPTVGCPTFSFKTCVSE